MQLAPTSSLPHLQVLWKSLWSTLSTMLMSSEAGFFFTTWSSFSSSVVPLAPLASLFGDSELDSGTQFLPIEKLEEAPSYNGLTARLSFSISSWASLTFLASSKLKLLMTSAIVTVMTLFRPPSHTKMGNLLKNLDHDTGS